MTENEQIFWNRVLELAKSQLKQATYEFFVLDARLIQIEQNTATIYLDPMKELFWDKNLKPIILTAGFEVYNAEIVVNYVFEEDLAKLETDYTKIDLYTKVHFVGCGLENDEIYRNFLEKFAIVSKNEHDSYYVKAKNQKQDLNLLHDLVVRSD